MATWLETKLYGVRDPAYVSPLRRLFRGKRDAMLAALPEGVAVQLANMSKSYSTKRFNVFGRGKPVVAIEDLSFSVPKVRKFLMQIARR